MSKINSPIPQNTEEADKLIAGRGPLEVTLFFPVPIGVLTLLLVVKVISVAVYLGSLLAVFVFGVYVFRTIPRGEPVISWLRRGVGYLRRHPISAHRQLHEMDTAAARTDGGTDSIDPDDLSLNPWQEYESAPELTGIKRIYPDDGYVLREDDKLVGLVEIEGRDVLFSEAATSGKITSQYEAVLNQIDQPTDFHIVSSQFDIDEHIDHHRDRLDDQDIANRPIVRECLKSYIAHQDRTVRSMNLMKRRVFAKREVDINQPDARGDDDSPFAGFIEPDSPVGRLLSASGSTEESSIRDAAQQLQRDLIQLQNNVQKIEDVTASQVTGDDLVNVIHSHWNPQYELDSKELGLPSMASTGTAGSALPDDGRSPTGAASNAERGSTIPRSNTTDDAEEDDASAGILGRLAGVLTGSGSDDPESPSLPSQEELAQELTSSDRVEEHTDRVELNGLTHARTYVVEGWPRNNSEFMLFPVLADADLEFSMTLRVDPLDDVEAVQAFSDLEEKFRDKADGALSTLTMNPEGARRSAETCKDLKVRIQNGDESGVNVGLLITVYADSEEELEDLDSTLTHRMGGEAGLNISKAIYEQKPALRANSPVGPTILLDQAETRWQMMGTKAAAGTFGFISDSLMEKEGVNVGTNVAYNSPVQMDIWNRDKGYNILRVGDIGSGKSFAAGQLDLRSAMNNSDLRVAIIDPLDGEFAGINEALDGRRVVINGTEAINPMRIEQVPESAVQRAAGKLDPLQRKIEDCLWFFDRFYRTQGDSSETLDAQQWSVLTTAIVETYNNAGITRDIETHSNPSPTILDLRDTLEDMMVNADEYASSGDASEIEKRKELARDVLISLDPFKEGGRYHHLAQKTDFDIGDEQATYIDMQQLDARGDDLGLMMQLVFSHLYQEARQSEDPWRITLDEAHKILSNSAALNFFEEAVRHSRHFDISFQFITQTFEEFFHTAEAGEETAATQAAEVIAKQCGVKVFHNISPVNRPVAKEHLDLNDNHLDTIESVHPGEGDKNYSEALLSITDSGYSRLRIETTPEEFAVLEHDPGDDPSEMPTPSSTELATQMDYAFNHSVPAVPGDEDALTPEFKEQILENSDRVARALQFREPDFLSDLVDDVETLDEMDTETTDDEAAEEDTTQFDAPEAAALDPTDGLTEDGDFDIDQAEHTADIDVDPQTRATLERKVAEMDESNLRTMAANTDGVDEDLPRAELEVEIIEQAGTILVERQERRRSISDD